MAKKPQVNVHVQSSDFKSLLQAQKESLASLQSIESIMKTVKMAEFAQLYETKKIDDENAKEVSLNKDSVKIQKDQLKVSKEIAQSLKSIKESQRLKSIKEMAQRLKSIKESQRLKSIKESQKHRVEESKAIANIAKSIQTFKTIGERFSDFGKKMKEGLSPSGMKMGLLKSLNIGGIFNKSLEREKFIKQQKAMNPTATRKELAENFEGAYKSAKQVKKSQRDIEDYKKLTGLSETEMAKYAPGREKLAARAKATDEYSKYDIRAQQLKGEDKTPTQKHADEGQQEEQALEDQRLMGEQTTLLSKIEENTRGASPDQKAKPKEDDKAGGGLLGNLLGGGGLGKALKGLKDFGVGIILVAGSLWVAAKASQQFAEVAWEDVGKGLVVLGGLVATALLLDKVKGSMINSAVGLGALTLATWGISAAIKEFSDLDWETIGKGFVAVAGLAAIGVVLGNFAGPALLGAAALGALGAAVWVVGKGFQEMGEAFNEFVAGIEKLSNIGFDGLAGVAGGLALLGPAMALFATGSAAAGMSNLVTGFLSSVSGQKSPIDQLVEIGKSGDGINKAGSGMQRLADGMSKFSDIKPESLKAIKQFPWEEATKFVAAGGAMSANGATVYNASKSNADQNAQTSGGPAKQTNVVNAPVNNVQKTNLIAKPNIRNSEPSWRRFSGFADF